MQIVGVVQDCITDREPFGPIGFFPVSQGDPKDLSPFIQIVLRSSAPLATITSEVSAAVAQVNGSIVLQFDTMRNQVPSAHARAADGHALGSSARSPDSCDDRTLRVMSYMVARRRNEIGIRMALGADRRDVVRMVMREAGVLLVAGVIMGGVLAVLAARTASALLFGLKPSDPSTLAMSVVALAAVAMLASYLPALRASRLEPTGR